MQRCVLFLSSASEALISSELLLSLMSGSPRYYKRSRDLWAQFDSTKSQFSRMDVMR